jgi:peptidyl-prolyl cis-trans isomerase SurA
MVKFWKSAAVVFLLLHALYSYEKIDGIAAVIDNEVILLSELSAYVSLRLSSLGLASDKINDKQFRNTCLNELIDGKVLLVHGKNDSMISITNEEVDQATNNHIAMLLKQNNLTLDSLESELQRQQGISLAKFKSDARKVIREQLLKQKVQQSYLYSNKVTKKDVEKFFNEYKDSLPKMGESVLLSKLSLKISPSEKIRQKAYEKIKSIKQKLDNGEEFEELAKKYSDGPEGSEGGHLGFIAKGTLSELVFEEKAFNLAAGQISEPFETRLGFHIVNVLEKRDQKVNIRQIFIKVEPPQDEVDRISDKIDSIRISCKNKQLFIEAVKKYSDDEVSKASNGLLRWTSLIELPTNLRTAIDSLNEGDITEPIKENLYISIYRLEKKVKERRLTLEDDYLLLEKKAKDIFSQKKMVELVAEWRKEMFIDIRL